MAATDLFSVGDEAGSGAHFRVKADGTLVKNGSDLVEVTDLQTDLAATTNGDGASLVGIEDSGSLITATTVEAALAELAGRVRTQLVTCTLTAAAESSDTIAVTINTVDLNGTAVARVQRYHLELFEPTMIAALAAAFTMAETGAGSEISTTANAGLIVATDANGDAVVTVTDVAGGSDQTVILKATPIGVSGTYTHGTPAYAILTFDNS